MAYHQKNHKSIMKDFAIVCDGKYRENGRKWENARIQLAEQIFRDTPDHRYELFQNCILGFRWASTQCANQYLIATNTNFH